MPATQDSDLQCRSVRLRLKCDATRAETRFRLSAKRTGPFKSAWASVRWTTDSRGVRISGSNPGYIMFRGSVKSTGYPLHSSVYPSLTQTCVTVCHHISVGLYNFLTLERSACISCARSCVRNGHDKCWTKRGPHDQQTN